MLKCLTFLQKKTNKSQLFQIKDVPRITNMTLKLIFLFNNTTLRKKSFRQVSPAEEAIWSCSQVSFKNILKGVQFTVMLC